MKSIKNLAKQFNDNSYEAIKYIVENDCKLQREETLGSDKWENCTLREMLKTLVGSKKEKDFYPYFLNFYRIKTKPTVEEISDLTTADRNEY